MTVDVRVDVAVGLTAADRIDQRRRNRILTVTISGHGQINRTGSVHPGLLITDNLDNTSVNEPIDVGVGCPLCETEGVHHVFDWGLLIASEICIQLSQLWLFEEVRDREEVTDDVTCVLL
ncbi:hypothetical protein C457_10961 [Haloferax prahovense DSM 18310]|uniref:Uncharacterized protein n=1 Tax=Haloferax prahovense (strain DSM 18310 / JCM 13924 / TL6) TaxID=1227461 RepID=M0G913_HALPT|nr:hypothetical protein C457_10961 [Haloferax prahovense DSM 18310]